MCRGDVELLLVSRQSSLCLVSLLVGIDWKNKDESRIPKNNIIERDLFSNLESSFHFIHNGLQRIVVML